jgi:hypothetical protein
MPARRVDEFDVYEFHVIIAESDGAYTAIGRDRNHLEILKIRTKSLDDARTEIRQLLSEKSEDYVGYNGAIKQFLRVYPQGFQDPYFIYDERTYKIKAHRKAQVLLSKDTLSTQIANKQFLEISENARKVFINLIFPNEAMSFKTFLQIEKNATAFAPILFKLLHGDDFNSAFDDLSSLLARGAVAKWTILTYWPFIVFPDKHMFMKPEVAKESARRLGDDFSYESRPNSIVYQKYLAYTSRLREGISELHPQDNIDVQTFMYAVGKSGFVREGIERRAKWIASRSKP